jgi:hypothetical protein
MRSTTAYSASISAVRCRYTSPRRRNFDHEADRIDEHIHSVENRWNLVGAVGVGSWEDVRRLACMRL